MDIIELIPSRDLRQTLREEGRQFTDMETATIIHNLHLPLKQRRDLLEQLAAETADERLRAQIAYSLDKEQRERDWFREASEGYAFGVQVHDEAHQGDDSVDVFFAEYETAHEYGCAQGFPFKMSKWKLFQELPKKKYWGSESERGSMTFNAQGELESSWLWETGADESLKGGQFAPWPVGTEEESWPNFLFFEDRWVDLPNLYELGDLVRVVGGQAKYIQPAYDWAIVEADHEPWEQFRHRVNGWLAEVEAGRESADRVLADFTDMEVTVEFPCQDGTFTHHHISPLFLERVDSEAPEGSVEAKLQQMAQWMVRGECGIDWFSQALKRRIHAAELEENAEGR